MGTAPQITLIGYGNQGQAWAANLRDSGWRVRVSGRPEGRSAQRARHDHFESVDLAVLAREPGLCALLLPDLEIAPFLDKYFSLPRSPGQFVFAHGYAVACDRPVFQSHDDVLLVAPKGIAVKLRENYVKGSGVLGVTGVHQDASGRGWATAHKVAEGLGCARVGVLRSSFAEEARADLFSEQALLCGPVPRLLSETLAFLREQGVNEELARFECASELRLIAEMMEERGARGMMQNVSPTARFGGLRAAERLVPREALRRTLRELWEEIVDGRFAQALREEDRAGYPLSRSETENL